jgi:hypothetical protein
MQHKNKYIVHIMSLIKILKKQEPHTSLVVSLNRYSLFGSF